jgi:hypothetical protein
MNKAIVLQGFIAVLFMLCVMVTPALANFEPQVVIIDEDGGDVGETLARGESTLPQMSEEDILHLLESATFMPDDYVPAQDQAMTDATAPYPLSPIHLSKIQTRLPKLYFSHNPLATKYRIRMVDMVSGEWNEFVGGTENCEIAYCWLQPTTKLKIFTQAATSGGVYGWFVDAKIGGSWVEGTTGFIFVVMSTGFTSTFDLDTKKWEVVNGTWTRTSSGFYKTLGELGTSVNTWRRDYFYREGLTVEVRMKRKVELTSSRIYMLGDASRLQSDNHWRSGYMFNYFNNGHWSLMKDVAGEESLIVSGDSPYAKALDWNTFKFWFSGDNIYMWFNDIYIGTYADTDLGSGAVGLAMAENIEGISPLLVDYVKVYYSVNMPQAITTTGASSAATNVVISGGGDYLVK